MSGWDDRVPFDASPATWKDMRDALFAAYAKVPVPPGVESIADTNPGTPAATAIAGGETVHYYSAHNRPWVTVAGPDGYAEFRLDDGAWTYVATAPILFDPFDGGWSFDDLGDAEAAALTATVSPPTIADAFAQWAARG